MSNQKKTNYRYPCRVQTPMGEFDSIAAAARAYNVDKSQIAYNCQRGDRQREGTQGWPGNPIEGYLSAREDCRGWFFLTDKEDRKPLRRAVVINGVEYASIQAAATALGMDKGSVYYRLKRNRPGYQYKDAL